MDFVCFSINNWEKRRARKQQFMLHLSLREDVGKVLYVEPPLNFWRLLFLPFIELNNSDNRRRWKRALTFSVDRLCDKMFLFTPIFFVPFAFRIQALYNINLFLVFLAAKNRIRKMDFSDPVLWLYHPFDYKLLEWFKDRKGACFDWAEEWADYFIEYGSRKRSFIRALEKKILAGVDLVFVVSQNLLKVAKSVNTHSYQLLDGTDAQIFLKEKPILPEDISKIKHPIVGYAGTITGRMDVPLLVELSERLPDCSFVFIGDIHPSRVDIAPLRQKRNVFFLGGKKYEELPAYLMDFDVCLLPYRSVAATSPPTKVFDYLACGKPIVTRALPELDFLGDLIFSAKTTVEFEEGIRSSLNERSAEAVEKRQEKARQNSWSARCEDIMRLIRQRIET